MRLSRPFRFDPDKGLEVLLYVSNRIANKNVYWVLKAPYFADKYHLESCGRFICGDHYVAMKSGPVPSGLYDIVKDVRDTRRISALATKAQEAFAVDGNTVVPSRDARLEFLSETDRECLNRAIAEVENLSFAALRDKSHGSDYEAADADDEIPFDAIVQTLPNADLLIKALRS
jgi:uncharacterized phage-associated protein